MSEKELSLSGATSNESAECSVNVHCKVTIHYCRRCRWLLRSAWMGQELLTTFDEEIGELSLVPNNDGHFAVWINDHCIWERKRDGGFPELPLLKQRVRDCIAPSKSLGHSEPSKN